MELPAGWAWATLESLLSAEPRAITDGPFGSNLKSAHYTQEGARVLRLQNVGDGVFRDERAYISLEHFDTLRNHEVAQGDLILASLGEVLPRVAIVPKLGSPAIVKADVIRARIHKSVSTKWVLYALLSPPIRRYTASRIKGVGRPRLGLGEIRKLPIPVPPIPEQQRIVETLEDHLSQLDSAVSNLDRAQAWSIPLRRSALARLRDQAMSQGVPLVSLKAVAQTSLGKMLDSKKNAGAETPYLRNINVRWGAFDLEKISTVPMPPEQATKFALEAGDLLVCEGGEPGRCAIWPGSETLMTFQKALHRVRPSEKVSSSWLALMIEESVRNGRTARMLTGTTIKHLPQEKLRQLEIPVPPLEVQHQLVEEFAATETHLKRLQDAAAVSSTRERHLRAALLSRAFMGGLVSQDPTDEPASLLLDRIRAEREAQGAKPKRAARRPRKSATVDTPPPPPASSSPSPTTAVQQELSL
ncbi:restriction endonuclease subunit S [Streptomyces sp. NBC_00401]|uniref:restriction endonuclease subunit S n=1 Tax=Streptomyces sp. NBC_00401 TaxID=2975738 RepID=UPI002258537D|nr:restriction endonuclease subunit S [Streptomyces sp. NBC_00401]MCX5082730.1 restriction endonuclease subunit S [Streptomyces sp. NBC_00401]